MAFLVFTLENFISGITQKLSRISGLIFIVFLGVLIGQGDVTTRPDYELYMNSYNFGWTNFESGYTFLCKVGRSLGWEYSTFRMVSSLVSVCILTLAISRLTKNISLVAFFYAISIFIFDSIQIRNSLMLSLVVLAFSFLKEKKVKDYVFSVLFLLLAASMHTLALAFLIPIVLTFFKTETQKRMAIFIIPFGIVFVLIGQLFGGKLVEIVQLVLRIISFRDTAAQNVGAVYNNSVSFKVGLFATFISVLQMIIVLYSFSKVDFNKNHTGIGLWGIPIMILGVFSVMMMQVSGDYCRLLRNTTIFLFIITTVVLQSNNENGWKFNFGNSILVGSGIILSLATFYLQISLYPAISSVISYII